MTAFVFYLIGGLMAIALRAELATPDSDFLDPNLYNAFMTNHGTIMIFLWIVPSAIGGFGNYLVPLMMGARDMAFPKLNAIAFWLNPPAGLLLLGSFIFGGSQSGWTAYPPLSLVTANNRPNYMDFGDCFSGNFFNFRFTQLCHHHFDDESSQHEMGSSTSILLGNFSNFHPRTFIYTRISSRFSSAVV